MRDDNGESVRWVTIPEFRNMEEKDTFFDRLDDLEKAHGEEWVATVHGDEYVPGHTIMDNLPVWVCLQDLQAAVCDAREILGSWTEQVLVEWETPPERKEPWKRQRSTSY